MMDADGRRALLKRSQGQERRTAATYGGTTNAGSGNGWTRKNDVRAARFLFENKLTAGKKQITLKLADLRGVAINAAREGRMPVLQFDLAGHQYVVLTEEDFQELII